MKMLVTFFSIFLVSYTFALDFKGVEEYYKCDKFTADPKLDPEWIKSVPFWYTPFWSKTDLYQNAEDFFGPEEFSKMSVSDLDKTCIYYKENGTSVPVYGFGGRILNYEAFPDPIRKGVLHWAIRDANGKREYHALCYSTLTDNKTYYVAVTLWWNGMKGFNIAASVPKLDEKTLNDIKQHVTEIGFNPDNFIEQDYEKCPPPPSFLTPDTKN